MRSATITLTSESQQQILRESSTINQQLETPTSQTLSTFTEINRIVGERYPNSNNSEAGGNENVDAIMLDYHNNPQISSRIISTNTRVFNDNELSDLIRRSQGETMDVDSDTIRKISDALISASEHRNARLLSDSHIDRNMDFDTTYYIQEVMTNTSAEVFEKWISTLSSSNPLCSLFEQIFLTWGDSIYRLLEIIPTPKGISIVLYFIFSATFSKIWMMLTISFPNIVISGGKFTMFYRFCMNKAIDTMNRLKRRVLYVGRCFYKPTPEETSLAPVVLGEARTQIEAISQETDEKIKELKKKEDAKDAAAALEASSSFSVNQVFTQIHLDFESFFGSMYTRPLGWMMSWLTGFNINPSRSVGRLIIFGTLGLGVNALSSWFLGINPLGWFIPRSFRIIFHPRNRWSRFLDEIGDAFKNYAKK